MKHAAEQFYDRLACLVLCVDARRTIHWVNRYAVQRLGYPQRSALLGRTLDSVLAPHAAQRAELARGVAALERTGVSGPFDADLVQHNGAYLALSWMLDYQDENPLADPPPAPIVMLGFDATALRKSQATTAMFETVAQHYSGPIVIADAQQRILYANPAAASVERRKDAGERPESAGLEAVRDASGELCYYLTIGEDRAQRQRHQQTIDNLQATDPLTGLPNRASFLQTLVGALDGARQNEQELTLLHVDIDDFLQINDVIGAELADRVIVRTAQRIKSALRLTDEVARLGNDKFGIILAAPASEQGGDVDALSQRLLGAIRHVETGNGAPPAAPKRVQVSASIGVAVYPVDGNDASELLSHAMNATASAKASGGDRACRFDPASASAKHARRELLDALRLGIEQRQLILHYQPQLSLSSGAIVGFEALIRWQHPQRGLVQPGEFIALAESNHSIVAIGEWALREACRQMRAWLDAGLPELKVAVNLSARHFLVPELASSIGGLLAEYRLAAHLLEIEITEGAMMLDVAAAIRSTTQLKALGVRLALDDFGTGFSSLAYLSRFPFDVVKIDQSFVRDITSNPTNAAIAQATIAMSHKLGKVVLAEGVESEEQMHYLRRNECDEMQGYYFSKPLPAAAVADLLAEQRTLTFAAAEGGQARGTVLFVDDETAILAALRRSVRRENYVVLTARDAAEAYAQLARNTVHVVVSDQRMPGVDGVEFLSCVKALYPETVRIVLSGHSDLAAITASINQGAVYRYLSKPWNDEQLRQEISGALRHWRELYAARRYTDRAESAADVGAQP